GEMPRRVKVGAVVCRNGDTLNRWPFAVRQLLHLEPGEDLCELLGALAVIDILDARQHVGRIRSDARLEGDRKIANSHVGPPGRYDGIAQRRHPALAAALA